MDIKIGDEIVTVPDDSFVMVPVKWLFDEEVSAADMHRLARLMWRYEYFQNVSKRQDKSKVYFPSQQSLCDLFGMSKKSQPKVSEFLTRMEKIGYVTRIRSGFTDANGNIRPRHFISVNRKGV